MNKRMNISNSTLTMQHHHHHRMDLINEPTAIAEIEPEDYNPAGAALFIIVVLLWYSLGIVCMLGMQIRARADTIEDCDRRRAKLCIRNLRDQTQTKQILGKIILIKNGLEDLVFLEELGDKKNRDKLWDIYLGKRDNNKGKLMHDEVLRIKNIEKQLAVIDRNRMIMNDSSISPILKHCIRRSSSDCRSKIVPDTSTIEIQPRDRRRSSLDQQIIERWKLLVDQSKALEQLPWRIRKRLIHRHFRRYYKNSSKEVEQTDTPSTPPQHSEFIDDEQCHLIPTDERISNSNSSQRTMKTKERLNPYITYFHLPLNENLKSNNQNFPLVTIKSDHHIIQMNHDQSQC